MICVNLNFRFSYFRIILYFNTEHIFTIDNCYEKKNHNCTRIWQCITLYVLQYNIVHFT